MTEKTKYEITLKKEVLREFASHIHADYCHYMNDFGIDSMDKSNVVSLLASDAFALKDEISIHCKNLEDLKIVEAKLQHIKHVLERLNNVNYRIS